MSPISQGPRLDFRLFILTIALSIVAAVSPAVADDDGVDLPVEFYFGRWKPGASAGILSVFEEERQPHWLGMGEYTSSRYRLGAEAWTGSPYPNAREFTGEGFAAGLQVRPWSTLQFGVDRLRYEDREAFLSGEYYRHDETFDIVSSLWFSASDSVEIARVFEQFVYAGGRAVGPGKLLGRAYGSYHRNTFDGAPSSLYEVRPTIFEGQERNTSLGSEIKYGLSERLTVEAGAFSESYRSHEHGIFYPQTAAEDTIKYMYDRDRLGVSLGVAAALSNTLLARVAFVQQYAETYFQDDIYYTFDPDSTLDVLYYVRDQSRKRERTYVRADLIHQVRGSFDNRIILDDYLDYYRHILFKGQQRTSLSFEYVDSPNSNFRAQKSALISFEFVRGLVGNGEFAAAASYSWRRYRLLYFAFGPSKSREDIDWSLGMRWRSYDYVPEMGPGWDRDSRADFVFGPTLPPGGVYLSFIYEPPGWSGFQSNEGGFLSFANLEGGSTHSLTVQSLFGLGGGLEMGGIVWVSIGSAGPGDTFGGDASILVRRRLWDRFEIRLQYEQSYREAYHDPAELSVNLAGIF